ncbi:hypothetical protein [Kutzneria sp. 744]|uniref:hypothetical protein n=1 Tax=Kutzneria sp. (strain 744) TaxID=345341 RepID=UPI0003EEDAE7|nr:hypothetical protein [Kutzneria sp. 744]EWM13350.1 hypothetical protein KUTG_03654 [Kutzneria sp. 744]
MTEDNLRSWLGAIADELIPAGDGMPAASAVGVADSQLDLVLAVRPDLARALNRAWALAGQYEPVPALRLLADLDPRAHQAVLEIVSGGYYTSTLVKRLLNYTGQQPVPVRPEDYPAYLAEGLLDRVVDRGPVHRDPDSLSRRQ